MVCSLEDATLETVTTTLVTIDGEEELNLLKIYSQSFELTMKDSDSNGSLHLKVKNSRKPWKNFTTV